MEVEPMKDTLNQHWKQNKTGFGFRMLQKMGWKEDKGLGKNETGIVSNIKLEKRDAGLGLGMTEDNHGQQAWSETTQSFNSVLEALKIAYTQPKDDTSSLKKDEKKKKKTSKSNHSMSGSNRISVGMKYKRIRESKDISSKSAEDKAAIFGAAYTFPSRSSLASLSSITSVDSGHDNADNDSIIIQQQSISAPIDMIMKESMKTSQKKRKKNKVDSETSR